MAYLNSPFESADQGGSIALAVMNAAYKHPRGSAYSQGLRVLIDSMLKADPSERPDIHAVSPPKFTFIIWTRFADCLVLMKVIAKTDEVLQTLQ